MNDLNIEMPHDEVIEIKRVMKIASARQMALSSLTSRNTPSTSSNSNTNSNSNNSTSTTYKNSINDCNNCKKLKEEMYESNSIIDSLKRELRECN